MSWTIVHQPTCFKGVSRPPVSSSRQLVSGILLACLALTSFQANAADVFGTATPGVQATNELRDRMANLERELSELKRARAAEPVVAAPSSGPASAPGAPSAPGAVASGEASRPADAKPRPRRVDPYAHLNKCYSGLPSEGAEPAEIQMVQKMLKHEVVGLVNGQKLVRDLDTSAVMAMSDKELKEYEIQRCLAVVRKIKNEAALTVSTSPGMGLPPPIPPTPMPAPKPGSATPAAPAAAAPAAPVKPAESKAPGVK